jgi:PAS domain S-box-containing protein
VDESLRLFLIEDDDDIALIVRRALERAGHQVTRCRDAADALTVLGHENFDLVLLDQRLPHGMQGVDLLQALGREGITVPVLMVTAYGDEQLATQVLHAGAQDYIVKDPGLNFLGELPKRVKESVVRYRLQHANRLLIEALESARDGILVTDLQGAILHVNQALEGLTGHTRQELLGRSPSCLYSADGWEAFQEELCRTIRARSSWQGERTLRCKDGSLVEVSLTVSPIVNSQHQLTHCVAILRDIRERRQLERQLLQAQKMQSLGTLAGGVAHEFNNLLAGINGYAALGLREAGLTDTVREFLQNVVSLSERAATLTRQMLTFARKPAIQRRPLAPAELLRTTRDLVARTLHHDVVLDLPDDAADGEPLLVEADANQLQQALVNLALNAHDSLAQLRKTGRGGNAPLQFRLRRDLLTAERPAFPQGIPPGEYVVLEVIDRGCGMTEEVLEQALDPFFTTKEVGQGTGLGLPMVFGIVQGHQGFLAIDSAPGQGTTVALYLPRLAGPASAAPEQPFAEGQVLEPEPTPGRSILVIDDEEAVQDVMRRFLEIAGHRVCCVSDGQEGLDLLAAGRSFDLVILDLMLPRDSGVATFQALRQRCPWLPVLLCTGMLHAEAPSPALQAGSAGLLRKPFRMTELWYAVRRALGDASDEPRKSGPNGERPLPEE